MITGLKGSQGRPDNPAIHTASLGPVRSPGIPGVILGTGFAGDTEATGRLDGPGSTGVPGDRRLPGATGVVGRSRAVGATGILIPHVIFSTYFSLKSANFTPLYLNCTVT